MNFDERKRFEEEGNIIRRQLRDREDECSRLREDLNRELTKDKGFEEMNSKYRQANERIIELG